MSEAHELTPDHRALIEASAILPEVAIARGYSSVADPKDLIGLLGKVQQRAPGLLIPTFTVYGERGFCQYRPDDPRVDLRSGRRIKYEIPSGVKMAIDCPPCTLEHIRNPKVTLWITEGVRKADALASIGLRAIALLGVWNWRGKGEDGGTTALGDWEGIALNGRKIVIAFDSDAFQNPGVHAATERLGRWLEHRGAELSFAYLPPADDGGKQGVDDFLAAGNGKEELIARVVREWRPLPSRPPQPAVPLVEAPPRTLEQVVEIFKKWLFLPDAGVLLVVLGAIAANRLPGDPVWLLVVGAPGSGKTEALMSASRLPNVHLAATLTEPALLSGSPQRDYGEDSTGGLLRQLGEFGILLHKDFGSVLSMHRDGRAQVLAALREVYDGSWTRLLGTDGGRVLHWEGKAGMIAGCTPIIDRHASVMAAMGDRFILYRLEPVERVTQAKQALGHVETAQMRAELIEAVCGLFTGIGPDRKPRAINDDEQRLLIVLADFCTRARSAIERDGYTREIELIPDPEMPARLAIGLRALAGGLEVVGAERTEIWRIVTKCALDSVPEIRLGAIRILHAADNGVGTTAGVADELGYPMTTTRRALEDLAALKIAERSAGGSGRTDTWQLREEVRGQFSAIADAAQGTVPEKSDDLLSSFSPLSSSSNTPLGIGGDFSGTVPPSPGTDRGEIPPSNGSSPHITVDCSASETHGEHHRPHPTTGRVVCWECHPPPVEVEQ